MCFVGCVPSRLRSGQPPGSFPHIPLCSSLLDPLTSSSFQELELSCGMCFVPRVDCALGHLKLLKPVL